VQKKALKDYPRGEKPITVRPGEILEPELETARQHAGELARDLDDVLIFALFPVTGKRFLMWKYGLEEPPAETRPKTLEQVNREKELVKKALAGELVEKSAAGAASPQAHPGAALPASAGTGRVFDVRVDGESFRVEVREPGAPAVSTAPAGPAAPPASPAMPPVRSAAPAVSGPPAAPASPAPAAPSGVPAAAAPLAPGDEAVPAPMPGMIVEIRRRPGEAVKAGEAVLIMEAMKMNNDIESPCDGVVKELRCAEGDSVAKGAVLFVVSR
jgi:pyruvate carboxylase subunit B